MANDNSDNSFNSLIPHLKELRTRFLKSLIFVLVIFVILFPFADLIYNQLAEPLLDKLPAGSNMIAIDVASPFFIPFKLVLILSVFISIPFLLIFFLPQQIFPHAVGFDLPAHESISQTT